MLKDRNQIVVPDVLPQLTLNKRNFLGNSLLINLVEMDLTLQVRLFIAEPVAKVEVLGTCESKQGVHNLDGWCQTVVPDVFSQLTLSNRNFFR